MCFGGYRFLPYVSVLLLLLLNFVSITTQNYADNINTGQSYIPAPVYPDVAEYPDNTQYSEYGAPQNDALDKSWSIAHQPRFNVNVALAKLRYSLSFVPSWPSPGVKFGQVSAVSLDQQGRVYVFHRGDHIWNRSTFKGDNRYWNVNEEPISQPTIAVINSTTGELIEQWGQNLFHLPHGLTVDSQNNVWVTDVALHQVMKFSAGKKDAPSMTLGVRFSPGNDNYHFCKPSAVAVMESGDFFVSDGYCNARIIKYSSTGVKILQWGRNTFQGEAEVIPSPYSFAVPHALALAEDKGLLCVADRENGRIQCFDSHNGTFVTQFHSPLLGSRLFSVAYSPVKGGQLYIVNGPEYQSQPIRGFVININNKQVLSQFAPNNKDFANPHDIAVSKDGKQVYVVELDPFKAYKFVDNTIINVVKKLGSDKTSTAPTEQQSGSGLNKTVITSTPIPVKPTATIEGLSLVGSGWGGWAGVAGGVAGGLGAVLLLLLGGAALLLRARHRGGCLSPLTPRNRRQRWDYAPGAPDFKLRHLLERPRGAGFERINTEESDEEPTPATSMLAPQNA